MFAHCFRSADAIESVVVDEFPESSATEPAKPESGLVVQVRHSSANAR